MQLELYSSTGCFTEVIAEISETIHEGKANATLLGWIEEDCNPQSTISAAIMAFENAGWVWNPVGRHLEKDGWLIWFRSQGALASPIAQWSKIP